MRRRFCQAALLLAAQYRARFDKPELQRIPKAWPRRGGTQEILHQDAAPGPELDKQYRVRAAHLAPHLRAPQPEQFAEDLADLRRSDKIASSAERVTACVITVLRIVQRHRHEGRHPYPAFRADAPGKLC